MSEAGAPRRSLLARLIENRTHQPITDPVPLLTQGLQQQGRRADQWQHQPLCLGTAAAIVNDQEHLHPLGSQGEGPSDRARFAGVDTGVEGLVGGDASALDQREPTVTAGFLEAIDTGQRTVILSRGHQSELSRDHLGERHLLEQIPQQPQLIDARQGNERARRPRSPLA